jgi:hypothetical protein
VSTKEAEVVLQINPHLKRRGERRAMEHLGAADMYILPGRQSEEANSEENAGTKDGITAQIAAMRATATNDNGKRLLHN